jgi:multidrug efflux pump
LKDIYVKSNVGMQVPLSAFTRIELRNAPLAINHLGQFPVVNLSFNLAPGVSLGEATTAIEQAEQEINLPRSINTSFQGTAAAFHNSLSSEPWLRDHHRLHCAGSTL